MSKPSITIAIPAYNEEENIEWVVKDALKSLPKYFKDLPEIYLSIKYAIKGMKTNAKHSPTAPLI